LLTRGNWYDPSVVEVPAGQYQTPNQTQSRSSPGASQVPVPSRSSTRNQHSQRSVNQINR
ncbi:MAG: hypothetical protein RIG84_19640, partial [Roseovarius sp.]